MAKFKKGQSGNPNGRPRGSRNKSSLIKAQLMLDDGVVNAAKLLNAVIVGDTVTLTQFGITNADSISVKEKLDAVKQVLGASAGEMKALAAEKKPEEPKNEVPKGSRPTFSTVASIKQKSA